MLLASKTFLNDSRGIHNSPSSNLTIPTQATDEHRLETIIAEKHKTQLIFFDSFLRKKGTFLVLIYDTTAHTSSFPNDYLAFHPMVVVHFF